MNPPPDLYTVILNGEYEGGPFESYWEAVAFLHRIQRQSAHYATRHGDWAIVGSETFTKGSD